MSQQSKSNKYRNNKKHSKRVMNNEKLEKKLTKILNKVEKDCKKKEDMLKLNKIYGQKLQVLLGKVKSSQNKCDEQLVNELFEIQQGRKNEIRKLKQKAKDLRKKKKQESKLRRDLKKIEKEEKKLQLESSRVEELPELKNDLKFVTLLVDGWNICGCDKIARKSMRGRRGNGAKRIIQLLQLFRNCSPYCESNDSNNINITIHFDGNGKDLELKDDRIHVKYSSKKEIVDDRLVRELGSNIKNMNDFKLNNNVKPYQMSNNNNPNRNYIVITSDRELTIRLNKIGVTCMKSGTFYKKYLKPLAFGDDEDNNNNNNNNNKDQDGDEEMIDKKKSNQTKKWKKYVKHKTFSDDSSSSSSSSDEVNFY